MALAVDNRFQVFSGFISAMLKLRTVLIWMLMLTMPLQAMAGMSMHLSAAMQVDSSSHASSIAPIEQSSEQSSEHCHDPVSSEQKQVSGSSCSHCTVCMSATAIGSPLAAPGAPPTMFIALARPAMQLAAIADTPERPPRQPLA